MAVMMMMMTMMKCEFLSLNSYITEYIYIYNKSGYIVVQTPYMYSLWSICVSNALGE